MDRPRSRNQCLPPPPRGVITPSVASGPEDEDAGRRASSLTTLLLFKQLCEQPAKLNIPKLPIQGDSHRRSPWRTRRSRNPRVVQAEVARQRSIGTERTRLTDMLGLRPLDPSNISKLEGRIPVVRSFARSASLTLFSLTGRLFSQRSREAGGYGHRTSKGSFMSYACCPGCRVRFSPARAAHLAACPECGEPPRQSAGLEAIVGFRLVGSEDPSRSLPDAVAVSLPAPGPALAFVSKDRAHPRRH